MTDKNENTEITIQKLEYGYVLMPAPKVAGVAAIPMGGFTNLSHIIPALEKVFGDKIIQPNPDEVASEILFTSPHCPSVSRERDGGTEERNAEETQIIKTKHTNIATTDSHSAPALTPEEENIMVHFMKCKEREGARFSIDRASIANFTGIVRSKQSAVLQSLEKKGYIKWERANGGFPFFTVLIDV